MKIHGPKTASTKAIPKRYTWGADVSGSLQGAGGVGGLLMAEETILSGTTQTPPIPHYYHYDGNGNVITITDATDATGATEGRYRYTAFGGAANSVTNTTFAATQPYRFSTKYLDKEVETAERTYFYGYRHYVPVIRRWPSRDPIGERGGRNLYGIVGNCPISRMDVLGLLMTLQECQALSSQIAAEKWRLEQLEEASPGFGLAEKLTWSEIKKSIGSNIELQKLFDSNNEDQALAIVGITSGVVGVVLWPGSIGAGVNAGVGIVTGIRSLDKAVDQARDLTKLAANSSSHLNSLFSILQSLRESSEWNSHLAELTRNTIEELKKKCRENCPCIAYRNPPADRRGMGCDWRVMCNNLCITIFA